MSDRPGKRPLQYGEAAASIRWPHQLALGRCIAFSSSHGAEARQFNSRTAPRNMSGLNGPHTQATGFNLSHSQLDSQPNYSFADLTQDGNGYADFPEFTGLTQVGLQSCLVLWLVQCCCTSCACHSRAGTLAMHLANLACMLASMLHAPCSNLAGVMWHSLQLSLLLLLQDPASQAAWNDAIQASALVRCTATLHARSCSSCSITLWRTL